MAATGRSGERDVRRQALFGLGAALVLLVAIVAVAFYSAHRLYQRAETGYFDEVLPIRAADRNLLLELLNEETAVRGYVINADASNLLPYETGRAAEQKDLTTLSAAAKRHPELQRGLIEANGSISSVERYFAGEIALVRRGPAGQRLAAARIAAGKAKFDALRRSLAVLQRDTDAYVAGIRATQRQTYNRTTVFLLAAGGVAVAIVLALLLWLPRRLVALYRAERSARTAAERGARASRALAHVEEAVLLLDRDDRVVYVNPRAERLLDVDEDVALGQQAADVFPAFAELDHALRRDDRASLHLTTRTGRRPYEVAQSRFGEGRVFVLRDLTEEQALERARSDFVATAAHELRTPIAAIYGSVRTIRRDDVELSPDMQERLLDVIDEESDRLTRIVDQILTTAQLDRGSVELDVTPLELVDLAEAVLLAADITKPEGIELVLDVDGGSAVVRGDADRLRQVLANLVENAIKYSPDGGSVTMRIRRGSGRGRVEVVDEGIGIPVLEQTRVFDKFYRLDPALKRGIGGSGLGLYISRQLVEQMGGAISVESQPGSGSTFTVELPLAQ